MKDRNIAIVIPVYNDWDSLYQLLERIDRSLTGQCKTVEIFIMDDYSTVSASEFIEKCRQGSFHTISAVVRIKLTRNMGHQGAIVIGMCHVVTREAPECIVIMDADGEDKPEDIPSLIQEMEQTDGPAIVFAQRGKRKENVSFQVMYNLFKIMHYCLTGKTMDFGNFSIIPKDLAESLISFHELWNHYPATAVKSKLPLTKVSCDRGQRIKGKSKMSVTALILHGLGSIAVFAPVVGTRMLLVFAGFSVLFFIGILCIFGIKFLTDLAIPGWATYTTGILGLLIFQSLGLSLLFVFFILNNKNPSQSVPKQNYQLFIQEINNVWEHEGSV